MVLGIIVLLGILLHLFNFWYNMMFAEIVGFEGKYSPTAGYSYIVETFKNPVFVLGGIFFLFGNVYNGDIQLLLASVISTNSIAELIISAALTLVIVPRLEKIKQ